MVGVRLTNFRGYSGATHIPLAPLTGFVGRNDAGKSSVLDALAIFFENPVCKIEPADLCVHASRATEIRICCLFDDFPDTLTIDASATTTLRSEHLLNEDGLLEIEKIWTCGDSKNLKLRVVAWAQHPCAPGLDQLLLKKNGDLKKLVKELDVHPQVDLRSNVEMRRALWATVGDLQLRRVEVPLDKEDAKTVWEQLAAHLPEFALFRADRPSTDDDAEVQDPFKVAIKQAIKELEPDLERIKETIRGRAVDVATRTLQKLQEFDATLASQLLPDFRSDPKWDTLFKLALSSDDGIAVNKRGSGVRRLVLFSFFRAEAERQREAKGRQDIIYAIEEPETAQHPDHQRMVLEALADLSEQDGCQVLLTTHVPALAEMLPVDSLRHLVRSPGGAVEIRLGTEDVYRTIAQDLGVFPDSRASVLLCVEGPNDIRFLRRINAVMRSHDPAIIDVGSDSRIATVLLGGSTLRDWVNEHYLRNLNVREVHIYDRDPPDREGGIKNAAAAARVNARGDESKAFVTVKREMENYLHPDAVAEALAARMAQPVRIDITDECDVENELQAALGGRRRVDRRPLKAWLNEDAASRMTVVRLQQRGAYAEIRSWFDELAR